MITLAIATGNAHKAREIKQILGGDFQYLTLRDFPAAQPAVEDGETFAANAAKKAAALADWLCAHPRQTLQKLRPPQTLLCVLADDSGLEVDALQGAPGVHSARFAAMDVAGAGNSPNAANNNKLLRLLKDVPPAARTARFRCVIALRKLPYSTVTQKFMVMPTATPCQFEGACPGRICEHPSGGDGFGYDPLFIPDGYHQSFAQLCDDVKNHLSHRALALRNLRRFLAK